MRAVWCVVLGAMLAGCQAADEQAEPTTAANASAAAPASPSSPSRGPAGNTDPSTAPASLAGEYRVAGIDGEPLNADFGIALSITEDRIAYEPECAGFVWNYGYAAGTLTTRRSPAYGGERQPDGSITACTVKVAPELRELGQAIDEVSLAERTPSNAIELSGSGRSVTLFAQ